MKFLVVVKPPSIYNHSSFEKTLILNRSLNSFLSTSQAKCFGSFVHNVADYNSGKQYIHIREWFISMKFVSNNDSLKGKVIYLVKI